MITFGHGHATTEQLTELLSGAKISEVIDVRRFPANGSNPAAVRSAFEDLAKDQKFDYHWEPRMGGRRTLPGDDVSPDTWWDVPSFRAYAAWSRTPDFRAALPALVEASDTAAMMGTETLWWRCHRRLISDILMLEFDRPVQHLMSDGRLTPHEPAPGARLDDDGRVVWDVMP